MTLTHNTPIKLIPEKEKEKPSPYGEELKELMSTSHKVDNDDNEHQDENQPSISLDSSSVSSSSSSSTSAPSKPTSTPVSGDLC